MMKITYHKQFSKQLQRDMEWKVFGYAGKPCIVFPAQDGRFYDYENFGMMEAVQNDIEEGNIQFYCVDGIDIETWSNQMGDPRQRILLHESWFRYIVEEMVPLIREENNHTQFQVNDGIMVTGCSMGGAHAMNFFLRRPDIFDTVLSLSGIYQASYFFKDYMDDLVYLNSPIDYMNNMDLDHPYIEQFRNHCIIMCCGQGEYEDDMVIDTKRLQAIFKAKQIPAWVDYWGTDVNHDWIWWKKQLVYFLSNIL